ncbi:MAG: class I SAM-dependent methyltransferase [Firmicutes bacterium]|nr:class I SAM-dependent methyltransferase [Bacillota bacterium]MBO2518160.1 class I SAM-dependent methyltransferase [Bacillota bacterium]NMA72055.1 class I SAM-dependent methyltransferase [Bacillota bacterium]
MGAGGVEKARYVQDLFNGIARRYDRMNLIMTGGIWRYWQWRFRKLAGFQPGERVLDVCCGTGDLTFLAAREVGPRGEVVGLDFSAGMLEVARQKTAALGPAQAELASIHWVEGDALALPFPDGSFDRVVTSFGMRNVADVARAFQEMARVVRPGGWVVCLELSHPPHPLVRVPYLAYFRHVVPLLGAWARHLSRGEGPAPYQWLPQSLEGFPDQEGLAAILRAAGLEAVRYTNLTGGIVCVHQGRKPGGS